MRISYRLAIRVLCWILAVLPGATAHGESSANAQGSARVQAHVEKGYKYLRREKYPKAIQELETARELSRDPCRRCLEGIALAYYLQHLPELPPFCSPKLTHPT